MAVVVDGVKCSWTNAAFSSKRRLLVSKNIATSVCTLIRYFFVHDLLAVGVPLHSLRHLAL